MTIVSGFSENDITDKKQREEIQKGVANGICAGGNHNHAIITREMACYILDYQIGNTYEGTVDISRFLVR